MNIKGVGIGRGVAVGPVIRMAAPLPEPSDAPRAESISAETEIARVEKSLALVNADLNRRAEEAANGDEGAKQAAPILQAAQLAAENGPALLAIDGRCGSGKSTLAQFLAGQLGCRVVHTDDFYLPIAARCANWQEQPGANIDFIRLRNEVLQPLLRGKTALYNAYSCEAGAFLPSKPFAAAPLTILEGSYSLHPALQTDFAVRVFVTCPPDVQAARLRAREGIRYANFVQRWIPLEEGYFAAHDPAARCNFVLDTAEIFV